MSFTEDELQAFNTILERRLLAQRRDMERTFDQRLNALRRDLDQRFATTQQDIVRSLIRQSSTQQNELNATLNQKLSVQQQQMIQAMGEQAERSQQSIEGLMDRTLAAQLLGVQNELNMMLDQKLSAQQQQMIQAMGEQAERSQQSIEGLMDRALAAQLLGIEQLISQRLATQSLREAAMHADADEYVSPPRIEAIEVQTDLPWEDLVDVFGKALDERFGALNESIQATMKNWEQYLLVRLHNLREQAQPYDGDISSATSTQELIRGIEHLERIIESMQVVMTTNHALLSNRLYHHQQLPLERAHPAGHTRATSINGVSEPLSLPGERGD